MLTNLPGVRPGLNGGHNLASKAEQNEDVCEDCLAAKSSIHCIDASIQVDLSDGEEENEKMGRRDEKRMPVYSREDIREQYCINDKEAAVLDNRRRKGFLGCFSEQQQGLCSKHGKKSFLPSCIGRSGSDEEVNELYQNALDRRPVSPRGAGRTWTGGGTGPHFGPGPPFRSDEDEGFDEGYFRRRPKSFCAENRRFGGLDPSGIRLSQISGLDDPYIRSLTMGHPGAGMVRPPVMGWGYGPTYNYTQPNTPDLLLHRRQMDESEVSLDDKKPKHVSFESGLLRSHTVGCMPDHDIRNGVAGDHVSAASVQTSVSQTPSKSTERLIDGRKTPDYALYSELFTPELARQIVLDRMKKTSMRTQATQTEIKRHQEQQLAQLQQLKLMRRQKMVSESVQTNGGLNMQGRNQQYVYEQLQLQQQQQLQLQQQQLLHSQHTQQQNQQLQQQYHQYQVQVYDLDWSPKRNDIEYIPAAVWNQGMRADGRRQETATLGRARGRDQDRTRCLSSDNMISNDSGYSSGSSKPNTGGRKNKLVKSLSSDGLIQEYDPTVGQRSTPPQPRSQFTQYAHTSDRSYASPTPSPAKSTRAIRGNDPRLDDQTAVRRTDRRPVDDQKAGRKTDRRPVDDLTVGRRTDRRPPIPVQAPRVPRDHNSPKPKHSPRPRESESPRSPRGRVKYDYSPKSRHSPRDPRGSRPELKSPQSQRSGKSRVETSHLKPEEGVGTSLLQKRIGSYSSEEELDIGVDLSPLGSNSSILDLLETSSQLSELNSKSLYSGRSCSVASTSSKSSPAVILLPKPVQTADQTADCSAVLPGVPSPLQACLQLKPQTVLENISKSANGGLENPQNNYEDKNLLTPDRRRLQKSDSISTEQLTEIEVIQNPESLDENDEGSRIKVEESPSPPPREETQETPTQLLKSRSFPISESPAVPTSQGNSRQSSTDESQQGSPKQTSESDSSDHFSLGDKQEQILELHKRSSTHDSPDHFSLGDKQEQILELHKRSSTNHSLEQIPKQDSEDISRQNSAEQIPRSNSAEHTAWQNSAEHNSRQNSANLTSQKNKAEQIPRSNSTEHTSRHNSAEQIVQQNLTEQIVRQNSSEQMSQLNSAEHISPRDSLDQVSVEHLTPEHQVSSSSSGSYSVTTESLDNVLSSDSSLQLVKVKKACADIIVKPTPFASYDSALHRSEVNLVIPGDPQANKTEGILEIEPSETEAQTEVPRHEEDYNKVDVFDGALEDTDALDQSNAESEHVVNGVFAEQTFIENQRLSLVFETNTTDNEENNGVLVTPAELADDNKSLNSAETTNSAISASKDIVIDILNNALDTQISEDSISEEEEDSDFYPKEKVIEISPLKSNEAISCERFEEENEGDDENTKEKYPLSSSEKINDQNIAKEKPFRNEEGVHHISMADNVNDFEMKDTFSRGLNKSETEEKAELNTYTSEESANKQVTGTEESVDLSTDSHPTESQDDLSIQSEDYPPLQSADTQPTESADDQPTETADQSSGDHGLRREDMKLNLTKVGSSETEQDFIWKRNIFKTGDVDSKKSYFEEPKPRKSSIGAKTPVGLVRGMEGGCSPSALSRRGLEEFVASPSSLARSPAMHEGFRLKDWKVERTPINTPDTDINHTVQDVDYDEYDDDLDDEDAMADDKHANNGLTHKFGMFDDTGSYNSDTELPSSLSEYVTSETENQKLVDADKESLHNIATLQDQLSSVEAALRVEARADSSLRVVPCIDAALRVDQSIDNKLRMEPSIDNKLRVEPSEDSAIKAEPSVEAALRVDSSADDALRDEASANTILRVELSADAAPRVETSADAALRLEASADAAPRVEASADAAPRVEASADAAPRVKASADAAPRVEASANAAPRVEASADAALIVETCVSATKTTMTKSVSNSGGTLASPTAVPPPALSIVQPPAGFGDSPEKHHATTPTVSPAALSATEHNQEHILTIQNSTIEMIAEPINRSRSVPHGDTRMMGSLENLEVIKEEVTSPQEATLEEVDTPLKAKMEVNSNLKECESEFNSNCMILSSALCSAQPPYVGSLNGLEEQRTKSEEQRTKPEEQRAQSHEQRTQSAECLCAPSVRLEPTDEAGFQHPEMLLTKVTQNTSLSSLQTSTLNSRRRSILNEECRRKSVIGIVDSDLNGKHDEKCRKLSASSTERSSNASIDQSLEDRNRKSSTSTGSRSSSKAKLRSRSRSSDRILQAVRDKEDEPKGIYLGEYEDESWVYVGQINLQDDKPVLQRSESIESTMSEKEFSKKYQQITHRMVHRKSSSVMYTRILERTFDCNKSVVVNRVGGEFGFRIHGSRPVVVSAIESGTPASTSGLCVGDILLTLNGVNVLDLPHTEVVKVAQKCTGAIELGLVSTQDPGEESNIYSELQLSSQMIGCGYLYKKKRSLVPGHQWTKRWFVLRADNCLYSFKSEQDPRPSGALLLPGCTVSAINSVDSLFSLQIVRPDGGSVEVGAESEEDAQRWSSLVLSSANQRKNCSDIWLDIAKTRAAMLYSEHVRPDCRGALHSLVAGQWQERSLVLVDGALYVYKNHEKAASSVLFLHGYKAQPGNFGGRRQAFQLIPTHQDLRHYFFYAETETEKKRWLAALEFSIERWMRLS